jgi:hypothetical protein
VVREIKEVKEIKEIREISERERGIRAEWGRGGTVGARRSGGSAEYAPSVGVPL